MVAPVLPQRPSNNQIPKKHEQHDKNRMSASPVARMSFMSTTIQEALYALKIGKTNYLEIYRHPIRGVTGQ